MDRNAGLTRKYSISMPLSVAEAAKERSGRSGLSAYVSSAVARQLERDGLAELVSAIEAETGPISPEEIAERREHLRSAHQGAAQADSGVA